MRATVVQNPGGPEAIEIIEVPLPEPASGEVRIRVEAAGVNPVDLQTREGAYHKLGWVTVPTVGLGWDVAGVVDAIGSDVDRFTVGMPVAALSAGVDRVIGTHADYVVVSAQDAAPRPAELTAVEAATVPLNALTASQGLDLLGLGAGRQLLVTGAAGGVGGYVTSLAAERGFVVTGLARASDRAFVEGAGAALITALPTTPLYDAVLDAAVLGAISFAAIRDDGAYVGVFPPVLPEGVRGIASAAVLVVPDGEALTHPLTRTAKGTLPARVRNTVPLVEAARAHLEAARVGLRGRIVLPP